MTIRVAMLVAVLLVGASAPAAAMKTGELLAQCEQLEKVWVIVGNDVRFRTGSGINEVIVGRCWGYLNAYFDIAYVSLFNSENPSAPPTRPLGACPPTGVSLTQFVRMFLQKARANPAQLHEDAFSTLRNLLNENFPCPR